MKKLRQKLKFKKRIQLILYVKNIINDKNQNLISFS